MPSGKKLKDKLSSGRRIYGTAIISPSPHWPKVMQHLNLDFVFIDNEHMALSRETIMSMCLWYQGIGKVPVVRILTADPNLASAALDGGAAGIIAPYIESVEQVDALAKAVHYKPLKGEKLARISPKNKALDPVLDKYITDRNQDYFLWINIESKQGIVRLPQILDVPGLDGVIIGPHDLSCSLDIPEQYDHPHFIETVKGIIKACQNKNLPVGIHFSESPARQEFWGSYGVNIILHSSDMALFVQSLKKDLNQIRSMLGESIDAGQTDVAI
ncbi:MAG: hypothetical protein KDC53_00045 [Saprospiraceae bacterium]|nr:hypothetical protein [Saprospiraceae bacterium]